MPYVWIHTYTYTVHVYTYVYTYGNVCAEIDTLRAYTYWNMHMYTIYRCIHIFVTAKRRYSAKEPYKRDDMLQKRPAYVYNIQMHTHTAMYIPICRCPKSIYFRTHMIIYILEYAYTIICYGIECVASVMGLSVWHLLWDWVCEKKGTWVFALMCFCAYVFLHIHLKRRECVCENRYCSCICMHV